MKLTVIVATAALTLFARGAVAQMPNVALAEKWSKVTIVHFDVVGEISDKHVQIPPVDADLYGDVVDRVTLSFDWNRETKVPVGPVTFQNVSAKVTNLVAIQKGCPVGSLSGPYEHFDIVQVKAAQGLLEMVGKRVHPDTMVTEACGSKPRPYKGAVVSQTEHIMVPDPVMLAFAAVSNVKTIRVSPDGKSIVISALNNNWVWTFTPTAK
jgi:hypothetical protein